MDKSDIFTAELILIFSLVIDISRYFHCRVWITSDVSIHLTSLNVPHFRNSNAYNSVIYERKHKVWVFIFLVRTLGTMWYQNYLCFQKVLVFALCHHELAAPLPFPESITAPDPIFSFCPLRRGTNLEHL